MRRAWSGPLHLRPDRVEADVGDEHLDEVAHLDRPRRVVQAARGEGLVHLVGEVGVALHVVLGLAQVQEAGRAGGGEDGLRPAVLPGELGLGEGQVAADEGVGAGAAERDVLGGAAAVPVVELDEVDAQGPGHGAGRVVVGGGGVLERAARGSSRRPCQCFSPRLAATSRFSTAFAFARMALKPARSRIFFGPEGQAVLQDHPQRERPLAHLAEGAVGEVVARGELQLERAAVALHAVDEGPREVGHVAVAVGPGARRDPPQRVHDVGDGDLLRAADHAVVAGDAVPGRVALQHGLALAGGDEGEDGAGGVVHVGAGGARAPAGPALETRLQRLPAGCLRHHLGQEAAARGGLVHVHLTSGKEPSRARQTSSRPGDGRRDQRRGPLAGRGTERGKRVGVVKGLSPIASVRPLAANAGIVSMSHAAVPSGLRKAPLRSR